MQHTDLLVLWSTVGVVLVATITDLRSRRIPNWLVLPFTVMGLVISTIRHGWVGLGQSLLGILAAAAVMGVFCFLGAMGMGDLKLCAAVGSWVGPSQLFVALVTTGLAGGVLALFWAVAGGFLFEVVRGTIDILIGLGRSGLRPHPTHFLGNPMARKMPYAPAIAVGTICSFFSR
jgi:prepilin peptidase CpaA